MDQSRSAAKGFRRPEPREPIRMFPGSYLSWGTRIGKGGVMLKWIMSMSMAVMAVGGTAGCDNSQLPTAPTGVGFDSALGATLARAIQDEYRAETIYQGVLNDFGQAQPFANVLIAEERHSASIARLYTSRGQTAPANEWTVGMVPHFNSIPAACAAGAEAERENIALYDELLRADLPTDVRQVFTNNRSASLVNHLPAFERCS